MEDKYAFLTPSQRKAILHGKGNALVSASAGSGKTFVVIERIIRLISEENVGIDKILAMTFTNLAADEMKEKLKKALIDYFNETGDNKIKEEISKIPTADISTIHSFCNNLLKRYFYVLGLDANFKLIDEKENSVLKKQAIDDLFESFYEEKNEKFLKIIDILSRSRRDDNVKEIILDIYNFCEQNDGIEEIYQKTLKTHNDLINSGEYEGLENLQEKNKIIADLSLCENLFFVVKEYEKVYQNAKKDLNVVDFEDIIKLAIKLLENDDVREELKNKYSYIFVDEYQDVNYLQEKLINLISNDNLFMVGDSKQSIYAFRGCNPKFFMEKFEKYKNGQGGTAISLDKNFRSASKILEYVNNVFSRVMVKDLCGYDYSENPMEYGGLYDNNEGEAVVHLYNDDTEKEKEEVTEYPVYSVVNDNQKVAKKYSKDALLVYKIISEKYGKSEYYDIKEKKFKKVGYGDICVLGRSKSAVEKIVEILVDMKIPVTSGGEESLSGYPEVKVMNDLVSYLNNACQDVPLASTLINFGNFNETELAEIRRRGGRRKSFYECVNLCVQNEDGLSQKLKLFLDKIAKYRLIAEFATASEVLYKIIRETDFDARLLATEYGERKLLRVETFINQSVTLNGNLSIKKFGEFLETSFNDLKINESSGEDTVKVMTCHASKGLEYPIVIAVGLASRFNNEDKSKTVFLNKNLGISARSFSETDKVRSKNVVNDLILNDYEINRSLEESRLLYVTLTRAKYELHLVVSDKNLSDGNIEKIVKATKNTDFLTETDGDVITHLESTLTVQDTTEGKDTAGVEADEDLANKIYENLTYEYPYPLDTVLPVKRSVSAINEHDEYYETTSLFGETSSEKGTAYHRFLELCSFDSEKVESELNLYKESGLITEEEYTLLSVEKLKNILKMPIFENIKVSSVLREQKFCLLQKPSEIGLTSSSEDAEILVQGVIDLMVYNNDNTVTLCDYKLSTVKEETDLIKTYEKQLLLYKKAIEIIFKKQVKEVYLINILQEKIIKVDI